MAYSNISQLRMLANDVDATRLWGARAAALAQRLGETETLIHSLNNVGTAEYTSGTRAGVDKLEQSLALALEAGLDEHVARAYTNLATGSIAAREYRRGDRYLESGMAYCRERDLDSWLFYMQGWLANSLLAQGHWDDAGRCATEVLSRQSAAPALRIVPLIVIGRLRARRGDPDPWGPLDEAATLAAMAEEVQRLGPVAAARAEAWWLAGQPDRVGPETEAALALAAEHDKAWELGELRAWRHRAGIVDTPAEASLPEPFRLELDGDAPAASRLWEQLGCPYEAAIVLSRGDEEPALRASLEALQRLGARQAAARVARSLRERGVRDLRRGPRASTRENAAGLTHRELEVLALVADGMRNGQIAERLVVSRKTVDHHVSAILGKLTVSTRTEAVTEARRRGVSV
jgi:ATP/maltotriose-dependent transcriptional regulator MalT